MRLKQLSEDELIDGRFYLGRGRNGNIGQWSEKFKCFLVPSMKFDMTVVKHEGYYGPDEGCFQPFMLIDEGQIEDFEGRGRRYGKTLVIGEDDE